MYLEKYMAVVEKYTGPSITASLNIPHIQRLLAVFYHDFITNSLLYLCESLYRNTNKYGFQGTMHFGNLTKLIKMYCMYKRVIPTICHCINQTDSLQQQLLIQVNKTEADNIVLVSELQQTRLQDNGGNRNTRMQCNKSAWPLCVLCEICNH